MAQELPTIPINVVSARIKSVYIEPDTYVEGPLPLDVVLVVSVYTEDIKYLKNRKGVLLLAFVEK